MSSPYPAPSISVPLLRLFRYVVRGYFRRAFHGVRIRGAEHFQQAQGPLVICANHGSWWDPMVCFLLSARLMPEREHFAPMEEKALERYPLLKRLGIFGVSLGTGRGGAQFLRAGLSVLARGGVLWVTPQGRFVDARVRPLVFKPGVAVLLQRAVEQHGGCTVLPLAVEYCFWDERTPECLLEFGEAIRIDKASGVDHLNNQLEHALAETMDSLKAKAVTRDAREFDTLLVGRAGPGGFYAIGQRIKALLTRKKYRAEHSATGDGL